MPCFLFAFLGPCRISWRIFRRGHFLDSRSFFSCASSAALCFDIVQPSTTWG
jgi:hypothetical protein